MTIKDPKLVAYADLLEQNGFTVYDESNYTDDWFTYSQMVDGRECFGTVQTNGYRSEAFREYEHHMPIKPSIEHGSSMWVEGVPNELTIEAARAVAQPSNYNPIVGRHDNYNDPRFPLPAPRSAK